MNEPELSSDRVAQAVYTWSRILIDGSKGMGFSVISPSLEGSVDWLSRLQFPEFNLLQPNVVASSALYEAGKGFSEVGRTFRGNVSIIYRKTAEGVIDPAGRRHLIVHTLFADDSILGLLCLIRMRDNFWIRNIGTSLGSGLNLRDIPISDIYSAHGSTTKHVCPRDHPTALNLLRLIVQHRIEREGSIEIPLGRDALEHVALAFPSIVADGFLLYPYLDGNGIKRELGLRINEAQRAHASEAAMRLASNSDDCQLRRAVMSAAKRFLYVDKPSFRRYAAAVLDLGTSSSGVDTKVWKRREQH